MLNSLPIPLILGIILGFLSGLGIGGGSLLIIWLTVVVGIDPQTARSINLLFFIPSAVIVCILRHRDGTLKLRPLLPAMISGCLAAASFTVIATVLDVKILKKLFGIILLAAGARELFYRDKEKGSPN